MSDFWFLFLMACVTIFIIYLLHLVKKGDKQYKENRSAAKKGNMKYHKRK